MSSVNKEFYQGVSSYFEELREHLASNRGVDSNEDAKLFASRLLGRLLFVWFLRRKGLIGEGNFYFDASHKTASEYYDEVLKRLFFYTLNTPVEDRKQGSDLTTPYLNGGLFEIHENDWANEVVSFPEGYFSRLFAHFDHFNFTTDESSPGYELVAIDPEMLGRVFESLLATQRTETGESARKSKGTFYTPREVVAHMCKEALRNYLYIKLNNESYNEGIDKLLDATDSYVAQQHSNFKRDLWGYENVKVVVPKVLGAIDELRVLDPACGSGAFPLGMVQLLTRTLERLENRFDPYKTKLNIIRNSIFGVDIEPMAIEIAKLRTWLALAVDESDLNSVEPLPNLDFKFICANSLLSLAEAHMGLDFGYLIGDLDEQLLEIRNFYFATSSPKKKESLKTRYYELTRSSLASELDERTRQLNSFDPFKFSAPAEFFDPRQMFGVEGFDIVIGNPPYIGEKGSKSLFDALKGSSLHKRFYQGKMDFFYFFVHLGIDVLVDDGILVFITTNYYPTATGATKLRQDLENRTKILQLLNFNEIKVFESALGQHNLVTVLQKSSDNRDYSCHEVVATFKGSIDQRQLNEILSSKSDLASTTDLSVTQLFDGPDRYIRFATNSEIEVVLEKVAKDRVLLGAIANVNQGLLTGIDVFRERHAGKFPEINAKPGTGIFVFNSGDQQFKHLRPFFKNSNIHRYVTEETADLQVLYLERGTAPTEEEVQYLEVFKPILIDRGEFKLENTTPRPWYELHRARDEAVFSSPKIVAPQRSGNNTFAYNDIPWYGSADIYYITSNGSTTPDLKFLLGVLNSSLMYAWLYYKGKRKGEMLELLQVPLSEIPIARKSEIELKITGLVETLLEEIKKEPNLSTKNAEMEIDKCVYELYGLSDSEIEAVDTFANNQAQVRRMVLEPVIVEIESS
jgi:methylase of polypeptide subunit release factors